MSTRLEELTDLINELKAKLAGDGPENKKQLHMQLSEALDELGKLNEQLNSPGNLLKG